MEAVLSLQLVRVLDFVAPILFPGDILNNGCSQWGTGMIDIMPIWCLCALGQPSNWVPFYTSLPSHLLPSPPPSTSPPPPTPTPAMLFFTMTFHLIFIRNQSVSSSYPPSLPSSFSLLLCLTLLAFIWYIMVRVQFPDGMETSSRWLVGCCWCELYPGSSVLLDRKPSMFLLHLNWIRMG